MVLSYDHNEPCKGCFFYEDKACGSERLIKCWDCKKEYIFTAIRKYNTTELCGIVKRYEETYKIILKTIKKIEKECQKYVIWDTVHVMLKDDGELIIKALSKDKSVLLNDFIIYVNNNGSIHESGRYGDGSGSRERNDRDSGLRGGKGLSTYGDRPSIL